MVFGGIVLSTQRVGAGRRRVARVPSQVRVGIAGFEHNNLVLTAGVGHRAGVVGVAVRSVVNGLSVGRTVGAPEPVPPVTDIGVRTDIVWSPVVIGIADVIVVGTQFIAQITVAGVQPGVTARVVDKDQFHHLVRRVGIWGLVQPLDRPEASAPEAAAQGIAAAGRRVDQWIVGRHLGQHAQSQDQRDGQDSVSCLHRSTSYWGVNRNLFQPFAAWLAGCMIVDRPGERHRAHIIS
jgi:hypothetical protein